MLTLLFNFDEHMHRQLLLFPELSDGDSGHSTFSSSLLYFKASRKLTISIAAMRAAELSYFGRPDIREAPKNVLSTARALYSASREP